MNKKLVAIGKLMNTEHTAVDGTTYTIRTNVVIESLSSNTSDQEAK